jgi:hypothetical protein
MPKLKSDRTRFLNVDLDIRARAGLRILMKAFQSSVIVLNYQPRRLLAVELAGVQPRDIDQAIELYADLIDKLDPSARLIWDRCDARCMNVGIQAESKPYQTEFAISRNAVETLDRIRAEIKITVYGAAKR